MFCYVNKKRFLSTDRDVSNSAAYNYSDEKPDVESHHDQHEKVEKHQLEMMYNCLNLMQPAAHTRPEAIITHKLFVTEKHYKHLKSLKNASPVKRYNETHNG